MSDCVDRRRVVFVVGDSQGNGDAGIDQEDSRGHFCSESRNDRTVSSLMSTPAAAITRRPSSSCSSSLARDSTLSALPSAATSTSPGTNPSRSRNGFGITNLPALSMVARIPIDYHCHGRHRVEAGQPATRSGCVPFSSDRVIRVRARPPRWTRPFFVMAHMAIDDRLGAAVGRDGRGQALSTAVRQRLDVIC
jgi:hypothetical protein